MADGATYAEALAFVDRLQADIGAYSDANFGNEGPEVQVLNLIEEVGELSRALLKRRQGIRGTTEQWTAEVRKEVGDILISLLNLAEQEGVSALACATEKWSEVTLHDWTVDRVGHGLPGSASREAADG